MQNKIITTKKQKGSKHIFMLTNKSNICYFTAFAIAFLNIDTVFEYFRLLEKQTTSKITQCFQKLVENIFKSPSFSIFDGDYYFNFLLGPNFVSFRYGERNDLPTFCESLLFNFRLEQKRNCYDFYKNLQTKFNTTFYLKCGHTKTVENAVFFNIFYINKKTDIQTEINKINENEKIQKKDMQICYECNDSVLSNDISISYQILPNVYFLEIERGYFDEYNGIMFYDKSIIVNKRIFIQNIEYNLESFIVYKKKHYSVVLLDHDCSYWIDNENFKEIDKTVAKKLCSKYSRLLIYKKMADV